MQTVKGLSYGIKANNSSQIMSLIFSIDDCCMDISLCGEHEDREIQVDFDSLNIDEVEELIDYLCNLKIKLKSNIKIKRGEK